MSHTILLNSGNSTFNLPLGTMRTELPSEIDMTKAVISLSNITIPHSWENISDQFSNREMSYIIDSVTYPIVFPESSMSISQMNDYMHFVMFNNGHYFLEVATGNPHYFISFATNQTYYAITFSHLVVESPLNPLYTNPNALSLTNTCPQIIMDASSEIYKIFGLVQGATTPAINTSAIEYNSTSVPDVRQISAINISCNLVHNPVQLNQILHSVSPTVTEYGDYFQHSVSHLVKLKTIDGKFSYVELSFTDQDGRIVILKDTDISAALILELDPEHDV